MTRKLRVLLAGLLGLLVFGGGFVCQRVADRGRFASEYSSYGAGPKGTRGLFLLAEALDARPRRWVEDLAALPEGGMLIALGACKGMARKLSRYEQQELTRWVEAGGVLLVAGARHYLPKSLGVTFEPSDDCPQLLELVGGESAGSDEEAADESAADDDDDDDADDGDDESAVAATPPDSGSAVLGGMGSDDMVWTSPADALLAGLPPIAMRKPGRLVIDDKAKSARVLLSFPDAPGTMSSVQREAAVAIERGRGKVIVLASASMLQNRELEAGEGGVLFGRLLAAYAPKGPLLFDEYHLGVGERRSMTRYLRNVGATPFALQLLLAALVLLWRSGARFGAIRKPRPPAPSGTASFVSALGGLFERAADPQGALRILEHQALAHVAARHHLPPSTSSQRIARALEMRGLKRAAEAVKRIGEAERMLLADRMDIAAVSRQLDAAVKEAE
jgi:hypothetical protein